MTVQHVQLDDGQHFLLAQKDMEATIIGEKVSYSDIAYLKVEPGTILLGFTEHYGEYSKVIIGHELQPICEQGGITHYEDPTFETMAYGLERKES